MSFFFVNSKSQRFKSYNFTRYINYHYIFPVASCFNWKFSLPPVDSTRMIVYMFKSYFIWHNSFKNRIFCSFILSKYCVKVYLTCDLFSLCIFFYFFDFFSSSVIFFPMKRRIRILKVLIQILIEAKESMLTLRYPTSSRIIRLRNDYSCREKSG